jgi:hypothetical protein
MTTACFGHLTFFLLAQHHAGDLRAAAVPANEPASPGRSLTVVMADRATVTAQLAAANARRCPHDCPMLVARRATLVAKLDALEAEAGEIRRWQTADGLMEARRDALTVDPVTVRLAALLGTTATRIDLLTGLGFAAVLESVACLLWSVTLRPRPAAPSPVPEPIMVSHPSVTVSHEPDGNPVAPPNSDLTQLARDVEAGRVRITVADIRRHLGCSQARAIALRRQLAELNLTA